MSAVGELYYLFLNSNGVSTDTRTVERGNMFFCLKGDNFNGNTFAAEALEKGASCVVVDQKEYKIDDRCVLVDDTLTELQSLAHLHRYNLNIPIIAITGTNGKTTTKELVHAVLSSKYNVHATHGNLNNHIGVPLTLLGIDRDKTQIAIVEMGANHIGEIEELCHIAEPNYGIITNIGKAHLEGFGSIEGIIQTKSALYKSISEKNGLLFVNSEDELLMKLSTDIKRLTYGKSADYKGICLNNNLLLKLLLPDYNTEIQTQLIGDYNFYNVMAAVAVGMYFSVPCQDIVSSIMGYIPKNNRSQLIKKGDRTIIIDAYNANPTSMEKAIRNLSNLELPSKTLLLGDMAELGESSISEHQYIVDLIRELSFERVYLLGKEFAKTNADTSWLYDDYEHLKTTLKELPSNATILIKGSRSMKMERFC